MNSSKESEKRQSNPVTNANFLSKWFFCWTWEIFQKGSRRGLQTDDLYEHVSSLESKKISLELISHWEKEVRRKKPSLLRMIFRVYGWKFMPVCILYSILEISIHASQPLFLGKFVSYFSEGQTDVTKTQAYIHASCIVACSLVSTLCFHPFMFFLFETGTRIRLACAGLVYRKCLRSSVRADNSGMSGFAISVLSTDLPQFDLTFYFLHELWKGPLEGIVFGYIMYVVVGWPAVVGIIAIAVFIPLQAWAAKATAKFKHKSAEYGDDRVKLMNEIITAIQVIKMYAWEKSFAKLVAAIRKKEIKAIRGSMNVYAALQCTNMISKFALFLSLIVYVYTGDIVTAKKVFIISSYYEALNQSLLHFWPLGITTWTETVVCAHRIVRFLLQSEDPAAAAPIGGMENMGADIDDEGSAVAAGRRHNQQATEKGVILQKVTASWDKVDMQKPRHHIADVNLHIRERQFIGITGNVGSGKTTLLNVILGELEPLQGRVKVDGVVSFASAETWVFEASIRDNIVFVEDYDEKRYRSVLRVCELERDIQMFPHGDSTIVGERGISLSGGQRARISLARAVYKQADIYVFDDPLSAVDAEVSKRLLHECFKEFLGDKIRILVTHRVHHLKEADHIVLLNHGAIIKEGSYELLREMLQYELNMGGELNRKLCYADSILIKRSDKGGDDGNAGDGNDESEQMTYKDVGEERKEQQIHGSISYNMYKEYFRALGWPWAIWLVFVLFVVSRGCQSAMDIFISRWASWEEALPFRHESLEDYNSEREKIVIIYTILMICTLLLYIGRTFGFFFICLRISLRLHDFLFRGIIRAYMYFFNTNPSGRILNRFSSDIGNIDIALPQAMLDSISFFFDALAVIVVVAVANFWLLIPAVIVIGLLYLCRRFYIGAGRSLKRIESLTRSPIYSHTNQTFQGLTTIRALNAANHLEDEFHGHQNNNTSALYLFVSTNRAFSFWTDLICVFYILIVTFSFLILNRSFYSGEVGLAITQSMTLIIMCQWGMRQTAETENNMTSVERVLEYGETPSEPPLETDKSIQLPKDWPHAGCLRFHDLRLRYSEKEDYVLKGLNFSTLSQEKIGIVGRTGAGKSSIIQAIFRLAINEGLIEIDGFDINTLGLHDLRSRISIIPQEPVLFSGTLRYNLDPFEEKRDEEMWKALEAVKLKSYVSTLEGGLNCRMYEGGANFSMGQRQLVCMARAILRHNKVLIMDEATANVDPETDRLIQETIHSKFENCTVLTIAHRLHTIMDNDRVMVMDGGYMVELGHPYELMQNKNGFLYKLVKNTGNINAQSLTAIAERSYRKRVTNKR